MERLDVLDSAIAFFRAMDTDDLDAVQRFSDEQVEFCDEISAGWARIGNDRVREYSEAMSAMVTDTRTTLRESRVREFGDLATLTTRLEQDYTLNGEPRRYDFVASLVLRQAGTHWKVVLGHLTDVSGQ